MAETPGTGAKRKIGGELIIPVLALGFTLYYFSTIIDSPWTAQVNAALVGSLLLVAILAFFFRVGREYLRGRAAFDFSELVAPVSLLPRRLAFVGLTVGYVVLIQWGGFTLTTFVFLTCSMLVLSGGKRKTWTLFLSAVLSLLAYVVFIAVFETRFPPGPFEWLMQALL